MQGDCARFDINKILIRLLQYAGSCRDSESVLSMMVVALKGLSSVHWYVHWGSARGPYEVKWVC